ncbi:unnamed protein product [Trichobilharzia szidati]|nr:unnamed protein product [Trichobilharzia szidati]
MTFSSNQKLQITRSSISQLLFSPLTSLTRLEAAKSIIRRNKCDSLLLILGIDSRYNRGSINAVSFLIFNAFEHNQNEIAKSKLESDIFEDVFFCISLNEIITYCNFASYSLLLPYISHWPNLRIHFVSEKDMNQFEKHEEMKVNIFECTMSNAQRIGIPYADAHGNKVKEFNKLMIEDWPLIQSYAFDIKHQSSREFFTLSREVIDVENEFHQLTKRIDPVFIESVLVRTLLTFTSSFEVTLRSVDSTYQSNRIHELAQKQTEALVSMYNYSVRENGDLKGRIHSPFIVYGKNTCKDYLKFTHSSTFSSSEDDVSHMIIHGSEQYVGISCERTYFLQKSLRLDTQGYLRMNTLVQVYLHLLNSVKMLVNQVKTTLMEFDEIVSMNKEELKRKLNFVKYDEIEIDFQCVYGRPDEAIHLIAFMFRVYNIQDENNVTIGSVGVKDTLLISNLKLNNVLISRSLINVTENIPYICFWTPVVNDCTLFNEHIKEGEKCLFNEEMEMITVPVGNVCLSFIKCICLENRVILYGKRAGLTVLKPVKIKYFRSSDTSHPDFIELQLDSNDFAQPANANISPCIYPALIKQANETSVQNSIWLMIKQRSKARRLLIENVFPVWRSKGLLEFSSDQPNQYVIKASFIVQDSAQDSNILSSHDDKILSEKTSSSKNESVDEMHNLLVSQILMHQPSLRNWIRIFRDELLHVEASLCLNIQIPTVNKCSDLGFKCGINPQSYMTTEKEKEIEWNRVIGEVAIRTQSHIYKSEESLFTSEQELSDIYYQTLNINNTSIIGDDDDDIGQSGCIKLAASLEKIKQPFTITVICGPPGSRKELVVKSILNFVKDGIEWIEMKPNNTDEISISIFKALLKYCHLQFSLNNDNIEIKPKCRGILLCPGITGSKEVLAAIAEVHQKLELNDNIMPIKIGCVATCIDLRMAVMDSGRMTFPGVLELLAEGWTNYLLLTGPPKSNQVNVTRFGVPLSEIEELLHSVNPRLGHLSTPDGKAENSHVLEALMDENEFSNPVLQRARLLSYPSLCTLTPCSPRLRDVTLRFSQPLHRTLFTNAVKGIFGNLKPWPFHGNIYTLNGQVAFVEDPSKVYEIDYVTLSGINRLYQITKQSELNKNAKPYWLTCTIADASNTTQQSNDEITNLFADWIRETVPKRENPRELIKHSDLTEEDLNKIHEKYHLHPLPKGWYYTGTYYVNMNGEKSFQHPCINSFIDEYIQGENNKIEARNARLRSRPVPDLFS